MRKRIAAYLLALLLGLGAVAAAEWDGYNAAVVLYDDVALYAAPQPGAAIVGRLRLGMTDVRIERIENGWAYVTAGAALSGWTVETAVAYQVELPDGLPTTTAFDVRRVVVISESVSLRGAPQTTANRITSIPGGAHAYILQEQGDWLHVRYLLVDNGYTLYDGWLLKAYTVENPLYTTLLAETPAFAYPDAASPRVGLLDKGTRLLVIAQIDRTYNVVSLRGAAAFIKTGPDMASDSLLMSGF